MVHHWALSKPLSLQVVTVNDYLARRDSEWVGQVHKFLGLQVGLIQQGISVSAFPVIGLSPARPDLSGIGCSQCMHHNPSADVAELPLWQGSWGTQLPP